MPPWDEQAPCLSLECEIHPSLQVTVSSPLPPPPQPVTTMDTTNAKQKAIVFI